MKKTNWIGYKFWNAAVAAATVIIESEPISVGETRGSPNVTLESGNSDGNYKSRDKCDQLAVCGLT